MSTITNECGACRRDFASVKAFDRHRTGVHAYTFREGLDLDAPREDGRRCLDEDEMIEAGLELDDRGRWRLTASEADEARFRLLRAAA